MPIIIKDVEWNQTENTVIIKVPLRGIHPSKTDIFYSHLYIKTSFEQYFFEAFLFRSVKTKESQCTLTSTHIIFELAKCEPLTWDNLESEMTKTEKQQLKKQYIEEEHKKTQQEQEELRNRKSELKRLAVREQMALDAKQSETIENIKRDEKNNALKEIHVWKESKKRTHEPKIKNHHRNISKATTASSEESVPPPRTIKIVNVSFTPREFPTPCRESRLEEENEWLRNQAEARRSVGFISEDLRPEEHNPQFLKSKGDEFLRKGNYLAAISAYTFGINLNDKFPDLYIGRSAAHLTLGNYNKTIQDCSTALDLMKPAVSLNLKERAACIGRRGFSLIKLGLLTEGIGELKASLKLEPNDDFSAALEEALEKLNEVNDDT